MVMYHQHLCLLMSFWQEGAGEWNRGNGGASSGSGNYAEPETVAQYANFERHYPPDGQFGSDANRAFAAIDQSTVPNLQKAIFLIIDTNFMLSHLEILENLVQLSSKYGHMYQLIIPRTTMQELDGLKNSSRVNEDGNKGESLMSRNSISQLARWANDWCYDKLAASNPAVRGQRLDEKLDRQSQKDDSILDCCLYFQQHNENAMIVLMSNDKNFCMKALSNGILTISYRPQMTAELIAEMVVQESLQRQRQEPGVIEDSMSIVTDQEIDEKTRHLANVSDEREAISLVYSEVQALLISAVDKAMQDSFEEDLELIDYRRPESMHSVLHVMVKFWISTFHPLIKSLNLKRTFQDDKEAKSTMWKYIDQPSNIAQLKEFLDFWYSILSELYNSKPQEDNMALKLFKERWDNAIQHFV